MSKLQDQLRQHLDFLCNACGERHSGSVGEAQAAEYIFNTMQGYGLQPEKEFYSAPGWRYGDYSLTAATGEKIDCFPCFFSNPCDLTGKIKFIRVTDRLDAATVAGRICLLLLDDIENSVYGRNGFAEQLDELGAAALIVPGKFRETVDTKAIRTPGLKKMAVMNIPINALFHIFPHREQPFRLSIQAEKFEYQACNIVARIPGAGKYRAVIGGHYDTAPGTVGAGDNASGTAVILELARKLLSVPGFPWETTIDFVAFSGEEYGGPGKGLGSFEYTRMHRHELDEIIWMCNLDDVGVAFGQDSVCVSRSWRLKEAIAKIAAPLGITVKDANPSSDNVAFVHNSIPDFWFYSKGYTQIHSPADSLAVIDFDKMAKVTDAAEAVIIDLLKKNAFDNKRSIQ
jgi:aminopeptidase YwaD